MEAGAERSRLEAFEQMLTAIETEYETACSKLEALKAQDKTKTVTYRQLFARKLLYADMLGKYEIYGLRKEK